MNKSRLQRQSLKVSLGFHGFALVLLLVVPWFLKGCRARRPPEQLMFVEFTVSVPAPAEPDADPAAIKTPIPEPPKPADDIVIPEKKPDVKSPEPPKSTPKPEIKKGERIIRKGPPPTDTPLSAAEIKRLLAMGATISDKTTIPPPDKIQMAAYFTHVRERMYAAWEQPGGLSNLPGLHADVAITVEPGGRITDRRLSKPSGNALMDDSVMKAVQSVYALRPLPAGQRDPKVITITFELTD